MKLLCVLIVNNELQKWNDVILTILTPFQQRHESLQFGLNKKNFENG